jgi:hypothetical protein
MIFRHLVRYSRDPTLHIIVAVLLKSKMRLWGVRRVYDVRQPMRMSEGLSAQCLSTTVMLRPLKTDI